jgi:ion channel-forming bestrophin family protein
VHVGHQYRLREILSWTRRELIFISVVAVLPTVLSRLFGWSWLAIPWVPISMLGTASAFTVGFRNNATYNRSWEARQIWGSIVNASRAWALMVRDMIGTGTPDTTVTRLIHRHIAWLTALRYQLREPRTWENANRPDNVAYRRRYFTVPEHDGQLQASLARWLTPEELEQVMAAVNRATAIIGLQSASIRSLVQDQRIDTIQQTTLMRQLADLLDSQGRSERIKGFPYPRQFATLNYWFIRLFIWLVPFGVLSEFRRADSVSPWMAIPVSIVITWLFLVLEKVGESTENPFEGNANDVPITALSRTIEIDLRQLLGETDIPAPLTAVNSILL